MKKYLLTIASLLTMVGLMSVASVNALAAKPAARTTHAPPAVSLGTREQALSALGNKVLTREQLKALGLKRVPRAELARIKTLRKHAGGVRVATAGTNYWYTWQNDRNSWVDRYYSGPYYSYPWYPYYVVYDNFKTCTYSGTGCIDGDAYTFQYLLYYYPNGTWYYYNTGAYQGSSTNPYGGFGPYVG
jgi:hypothetical protein